MSPEEQRQMHTALEEAERLRSALRRRERQVAALRGLSEALFGETDSDEVLRRTLDIALETVHAACGALQLYDSLGDELVFHYVVGRMAPKLQGRRVPATQGIAGQVLRTGVPDVTRQAREHGALNPLVGVAPEGSGCCGETMISLALKRPSGEAIGVLQLLKVGGEGESEEDEGDLEVLQVLVATAAGAIETARLSQAARRAEIVNVIGDISHDIKNMLTPIESGLWALEPLLDDLFGELDAIGRAGAQASPGDMARAIAGVRDNYSWIFDSAHNACAQVVARAREIADAVKGEMAPPFFEDSDLNDTVGEVAQPLFLVADKANVHLHFDLGQGLPRAELDRKQMYTALYNLVNNAIPETPSGGSITIRTGSQLDAKGEERLLLEVQDTGRGMPEHVRSRLFTDRAVSTKAGGTGLGTRIIGGVVERHNGTIRVRSEPGQGTTFSILLPLKHRAPLAALSSSAPPPARRHNLPTLESFFVGRERERQAVRKLLARSSTRLLCLSGPGGSGKTRLALEVAGEMVDDFEDGVWLVSLAQIAPSEGCSRVASAIASTLGVREEAGRSPFESLQEWLSSRRLLLILDNFEQILHAAPLVSDLLASCSGLQVLATSRSALRLRGEREMPVPPLALPALPAPHKALSAPQLEEMSSHAAIALFVERGAQSRPGFELTPENASDVAHICTRLDGLPLAIELAAAHLKILAPHAMRARLESHLALPGRGPSDAPLRHQTLRAALDWSHDLLGPEEQKLLRRLMVFEGGCSPEAAQAVAGEGGQDGQDGQDGGQEAWRGLWLLCGKSLLRSSERPDGQPWFSALQTIREYGLQKLAQNGEESEVRRRHAHYYLHLAEAALDIIFKAPEAAPPPPELPAADAPQAVWRAWQELEHGNFRVALQWFLDNTRVEQPGEEAQIRDGALRMALALALTKVWRGGRWMERRQALERALESCPEAPGHRRLRAMLFVGDLCCLQADHEHAERWARQSLGLAQSGADLGGDRWGEARSLGILAKVALEDGDFERALALHRQSLSIYQEEGQLESVSWTLLFLGQAAERAEDALGARKYLEQALEVFEATGDREGRAYAMYELGRSLYDPSDADALARAQGLLDESLSTFREMGHPKGIASVLALRGQHAADEGDLARAREQLSLALELFQQLGDRPGVGDAARALGEVSLKEGDLSQSRALLREALEATRPQKNALRQSELLGSFARLAVAHSYLERAARLLGAAQPSAQAQSPASAQAAGRAASRRRGEQARAASLARAVLGAEVFDAAFEQGRAMSPQQAWKEALQV